MKFDKEIMQKVLVLSFFGAFFITVISGYALNIIKIIEAGPITGFILVRCIGVFVAPLGSILGWF